jgi:hypothetical protein
MRGGKGKEGKGKEKLTATDKSILKLMAWSLDQRAQPLPVPATH